MSFQKAVYYSYDDEKLMRRRNRGRKAKHIQSAKNTAAHKKMTREREHPRQTTVQDTRRVQTHTEHNKKIFATETN